MVTDSDSDEFDVDQYVECPEDGLLARRVGDWSKDKHYYLKRYIDIFETSMHKQWSARAYIDPFAGPGVCAVRKRNEFIDGSPLLALKTKYPFTDYFFSDLDGAAVAALRSRCAPFESQARITVAQKDFNAVAHEMASVIDNDTLSLAFLDPTGLDVKFGSLRTLTKGKKMDLILYFPHGSGIKRNIDKFHAKEESKMDDFFDGREWRAIYESGAKNLIPQLLELYKTKLASIGYRMEPADAVMVTNSNNLPMYALLFASKDPLGNKFWKKIKQIESKGQRGLFGF